jgi:hypothetical protein
VRCWPLVLKPGPAFSLAGLSGAERPSTYRALSLSQHQVSQKMQNYKNRRFLNDQIILLSLSLSHTHTHPSHSHTHVTLTHTHSLSLALSLSFSLSLYLSLSRRTRSRLFQTNKDHYGCIRASPKRCQYNVHITMNGDLNVPCWQFSVEEVSWFT